MSAREERVEALWKVLAAHRLPTTFATSLCSCGYDDDVAASSIPDARRWHVARVLEEALRASEAREVAAGAPDGGGVDQNDTEGIAGRQIGAQSAEMACPEYRPAEGESA